MGLMPTSRSAVFVAIPAIGHLNPLLRQAAELQRRGWRVAMATTDEMRGYVEDSFPDVRFASIGTDPTGPRSKRALQARVSAASNLIGGTLDIMRWINSLWPTMFDGLLAEVRRDRPDVLVVDLVTTAGMDVAELEGIPYVVNNADLLTIISVALLPPAPGVPLLFSGRSIYRIGRLDRLLNPLLRWLGATMFDLMLSVPLNRLRNTRGLRPRRTSRRPDGVLIMTDSAFGLEYNRPLPPLMQMVGPMLDDTPAVLAEELQTWLGTGLPVVFVNLGTLARPGEHLLDQIARGLESSEFRALWVLREPPPMSLPANVRVERWVDSQTGVLAHPNVRVFVSHCGINSVHESLSAGTPVVGLPIMADQRDMAQRVADAGVGVILDKRRLSPKDLGHAIRTVLHEPKFTRNIAPIQASFELAGGVRRAADLIEHVATFGVAHWRMHDSGRQNVS
jgi:UDP:flavonoid glycosyltransferase YjiC (YdhE family)